MAMNGYASLVKQRASGATKRRKLDDYETPSDTTLLVCDVLPNLSGRLLEPACGSGRMVRALKKFYGSKLNITSSDIKQGKDFLKRTAVFKGHIFTNPPYRDGLADAFVNHALKLADGMVGMLMESGFLWGEKRASNLYNEVKPLYVIVIPNRVYFHEGSGKPITSQFYKHAWVIWPDRKTRLKGDYETKTIWPDVRGGF